MRFLLFVFAFACTVRAAPDVRGVRTDQWKYIRYPHGPRIDSMPDQHLAELYDLSVDPDERRNLASAEKYAPVRTDLKKQLAGLMAAAGLTPESDTMPVDAGIKAELPDQKIR